MSAQIAKGDAVVAEQAKTVEKKVNQFIKPS